jgi:hypothetical protein
MLISLHFFGLYSRFISSCYQLRVNAGTSGRLNEKSFLIKY